MKQLCCSAGPSNTMLQLEFMDALKNNNKLAALALHAAFSRPPSSTSTRAKGRYRERALIAYEGTAFPAQYMPSHGTYSKTETNVSYEHLKIASE